MMAGLTTKDGIANQNGKETYDVQLVRGIGAIKKRWLRSVGVRTLQDLAQASAAEIEFQLKQSGRVVSSSEIEGWIAQAQALVMELLNAQPRSVSSVISEVQPTELAPDRELVQENGQPSTLENLEKADLWKTIAAFTIEVQAGVGTAQQAQRTRVQCQTTDRTETWTGVEIDQLLQWVRSQLNSLQSKVETANSMATTPVTVDINQLRLLRSTSVGKSMVVDKTQRLFPESIQPGEPFILEVSIEVAGGAVERNQSLISYRAQCFARHSATGKVIELSDLQTEIPYQEQSFHSLRFPPIFLENPGAYRLQVVVTPQNLPATAGSFKVPLLQVI
ncbi:hypothetical protein K9N68_18230 [Kovacikia minuta CCNUW1]|uniref:hypothetical protein n=1 Tax=Kovacikia minuta TaxID=2931930 RepID=UPI001CCCCAB7|nr:hypothetical protein [Kovacikia minuta]UBF23708.1 hypothetical protein K9N68_18230 [Kovacikia minuta CCNUW1]